MSRDRKRDGNRPDTTLDGASALAPGKLSLTAQLGGAGSRTSTVPGRRALTDRLPMQTRASEPSSGASEDVVADLLAKLTPATVHDLMPEVEDNHSTVRDSPRLQALFDTIVAHARPDDLACVSVLRWMMCKLGEVPLDPGLADGQWRTTTRVADALTRVRSTQRSTLEHLVSAKPVKAGTPTRVDDQQISMSLERVLLRLEDLRSVIGIAVDPLATTQENPGTTFDPTKADNELARITRMGFHTVRIEIDVPLDPAKTQPGQTFVAEVVKYNALNQGPPLLIDLLVNFRGGIDNPRTGLDAVEIARSTASTEAKQRTYAIALMSDVLDKVKPGPGPIKDFRSGITQLRYELATVRWTPAIRDQVIHIASTILHGDAADYARRFAFGDPHYRTVAQIGADLGTEAARLVASLNMGASLRTVELGNEPEAQWKTPHVNPIDDQVGLDTSLIDASLNAFRAHAPGLGDKVIPAASEWDPASAHDEIKRINGAIMAGTMAPDDIPSVLHASPWGRALDAYAAKHTVPRGKPPGKVPLTVHIYNSPVLARALIAVIGQVAVVHNVIFDVSLTELQLDSVTHDSPIPQAKSDGVIDLGVAVMDAAASAPAAGHVTIVQVIAFAYQRAPNEPGQDFHLRGNVPLATLLGDPVTG